MLMVVRVMDGKVYKRVGRERGKPGRGFLSLGEIAKLGKLKGKSQHVSFFMTSERSNPGSAIPGGDALETTGEKGREARLVGFYSAVGVRLGLINPHHKKIKPVNPKGNQP